MAETLAVAEPVRAGQIDRGALRTASGGVFISGLGPLLVRNSPVDVAATAFWRIVIALPAALWLARRADGAGSTLPDGDDARTVEVGVREATGRPVLQSRVWRRGEERTFAWPLTLAPRSYELEAKTRAGHMGKARLEVLSGKPAEPVTIELR